MTERNNVAALSTEEVKELSRMEDEFKGKYKKDVVVVAYEKE